MSLAFLEKLAPKLPVFAFDYWDCFLGICFVLFGLYAFVQNISHAVGLILFGFGLLAFSMFRRCWHYVGRVRLSDFSPQYKRGLAFPKVVASIVWLVIAFFCFRSAAIDFGISAAWVRRVLGY